MPSSRKSAIRPHGKIRRHMMKAIGSMGLVSLSLLASDGRAESTPASKMFPDTTQALITLPDTPKFLELWNKTQLGKLAIDDKLVSFWETQRKELQSRFSDAGWQMSLQVEDLEHLSAGQTTLGWIARTGEKPYSIGLVIDIGESTVEAEKFLKRVDQQLKDRKAQVKTWEDGSVKVTQYFVPSPSDETRILESNYAVHGGQLIATDDTVTMKELLAAQSGTRSGALADSPLYQDALSKVKGDGPAEVEYFVRPIGIAKLLRSISGKPPKNQQDLIKLLEDQGFDAIRCAIGHVHFNESDFDVFHHGFVKLEKPVKPSVEILDFPNVETLEPPVWLNKDSALVLGFSWNLKDAFPKFENIVDAYVGEDTFAAMMEGMRDDPQGPQIDIAKEILPYISTEFFLSTEIVKPVTPESKRSLVLLKLNDPDKKLNRVVDRYGSNETISTPEDYEGYRIWSFKNEEEVEVELDFGSPKTAGNAGNANQTDEPLLEQYAISIVEGYFVFGSDTDLIKELIDRVKSAPKESEFNKQADVQRARSTMEAISGGSPVSALQIDRTDKSFEMQYELFREGKLNASRSILAAVLDRLLDPKHKNREQEQKLKGDTLPPFEAIRGYFMPAGSVIRTEEDGWSIQSYVLQKEER